MIKIISAHFSDGLKSKQVSTVRPPESHAPWIPQGCAVVLFSGDKADFWKSGGLCRGCFYRPVACFLVVYFRGAISGLFCWLRTLKNRTKAGYLGDFIVYFPACLIQVGWLVVRYKGGFYRLTEQKAPKAHLFQVKVLK